MGDMEIKSLVQIFQFIYCFNLNPAVAGFVRLEQYNFNDKNSRCLPAETSAQAGKSITRSARL